MLSLALMAVGLQVLTLRALGPLSKWPRWPALWFVALSVLAGLGWLQRSHPLHGLLAGPQEYLMFGPLSLLVLGLPGFHIPRKATRWILAGLSLLVFTFYGVGPLLAPSVWPPVPAIRGSRGVWLQGDSYGCGPSASLTALELLGVQGDFQAIAQQALTSPLIGTAPDLLCRALEKLYPVRAVWLQPRSLAEAGPGPMLLILHLGPMVDHYVALLEQDSEGMWIGDPLDGRRRISVAEFRQRWTGALIRLERRP